MKTHQQYRPRDASWRTPEVTRPRSPPSTTEDDVEDNPVFNEDPNIGPALETENRDEDAPAVIKKNPWRPILAAPKDRIVEGRFSTSETEGRPIRWRNTRRRAGPYTWVYHGVWHAAETAGAVRLNPIEWREWMPAGIHFAAPDNEAAE